MSDDAINAGDLVYVARDCCGAWLGQTFSVGWIQQLGTGDFLWCDRCGAAYVGVKMAIRADAHLPGSIANAPVSMLKKYRPPGELETARDSRDLTVPARFAEKEKTP